MSTITTYPKPRRVGHIVQHAEGTRTTLSKCRKYPPGCYVLTELLPGATGGDRSTWGVGLDNMVPKLYGTREVAERKLSQLLRKK